MSILINYSRESKNDMYADSVCCCTEGVASIVHISDSLLGTSRGGIYTDSC